MVAVNVGQLTTDCRKSEDNGQKIEGPQERTRGTWQGTHKSREFVLNQHNAVGD